MANNETREAVALLPCPFCGGKAEVCKNDHDDPVWSVDCDACPASLGSMRFSRAEAIAAWNRRPAPMEAVAWRVRDKEDPRGWWLYGVHETETVAELKRQEHEVQALAVIPTHGLGSSLRDTHRVAETAVVAALTDVATLADRLINGGGLVVVEHKDRSDPHYQLCVALETLAKVRADVLARRKAAPASDSTGGDDQ